MKSFEEILSPPKVGPGAYEAKVITGKDGP